MKNSILLKLFTATIFLCLSILGVVYVTQVIFFKQYYVDKKVEHIEKKMNLFEEAYLSSNQSGDAVDRLEQEFFQNNNAWITSLDPLGYINQPEDSYIEVQLEQDVEVQVEPSSIKIPLYLFSETAEFTNKTPFLMPNEPVIIQFLKKGEALIPYRLNIKKYNRTFENTILAKKILSLYADFENSKDDPSLILQGTITKVHLPEAYSNKKFIYKNQLLLDQIKAFQAELLLSTKENQIPLAYTFTVNTIDYQVLIKPSNQSDTTYYFAMTSLQPVGEAVAMMEGFYLYILFFVMFLILIVSFYYSKMLAKPLLQINQTTKKIAALDFSEKILITSTDEIGDLSRNINFLSDQLDRYIGKLKEDLNKEKQLELTRKEFVSGVSHELKTPLAVIESCVSILKDNIAPNKRDHYFNAISDEVKHMNHLITDMLELAKFESGTYKLEREPFLISALIERCVHSLLVQINEKQLVLNKKLLNVSVLAHERYIGQVITNFLSNAIRYSPNGACISILAIQEEEQVKVSVENKGAQFSQVEIEKIWDRFYRGEASRSRSSGGTGLGLAISKQILNLHGVKYGVNNTEDGVMFYFYLDLHQSGKAAQNELDYNRLANKK